VDRYALSVLVLGFILASAALGSYYRSRLPNRLFGEDALGAMRIAVGLVATLAALVLSLLISAGKSSLDLVNAALERNTVAMIRLDHTLSQFGPTTDELRVLIKDDYSRWISFLFSSKTGTQAEVESQKIIQNTFDIQERILAIQPVGALQDKLKDRALQLWDDVFAGRWVALEHRRGSIPAPLIMVLVGWLSVIFGVFGFSAPRSRSMCIVFLLCALSATTAVYIVLDLDTPFRGMVNASKTPMLDALKLIGQ
jgi:hypothetical protein